MRKSILGSSAVVLAVITGAAALLFSPAGCSCTDVWEDYVVLAGLTGVERIDDITQARLQAGLWDQFRDQRLEPGEHILGERYGCASAQPLVVTCHSVLETSALMRRGFDLRYDLTPDGRLKSVRVQRFTEWRPERRLDHDPQSDRH